MAKKQTRVDLSYRITHIQTLKFSFEDLDQEIAQKLFDAKEALSLNISVKVNIHKEKDTLSMDINTLLTNRQQKGKTLIEHSGRTTYAIEGLQGFYNEKEGVYNLPDDFRIQLFALAYTHARALLAVEIGPTVFNGKYMLPVVDPKQFWKQSR